MSLTEHLRELRNRLAVSIGAVAVFAILGYVFYDRIISFLQEPAQKAIAEQQANGHDVQLSIIGGVASAFTLQVKVACIVGVILACPVWLYQLWRFITPGLNPKEKKYAIPFVLSSIFLFILGGFVALLTLEPALNFLLQIGGSDVTPALTYDKYVSLVALMIVAFGLSFEFPVILMFLLLARVLSTQQLRKWRRYAIVIIVAFAAIITPSQDPYSLFAMAIPMYIFYEACIIIGRFMKR